MKQEKFAHLQARILVENDKSSQVPKKRFKIMSDNKSVLSQVGVGVKDQYIGTDKLLQRRDLWVKTWMEEGK